MALALLLAACGGAEQRLVARGDGVPVLATLATRGGTGAERLRAGDLAVARALFDGASSTRSSRAEIRSRSRRRS